MRQYQDKAVNCLHDLEPLRQAAAERGYEVRLGRAEQRSDDTHAEQGIFVGDQVLRYSDARQSKLYPRWQGPSLVRALAPEGMV